MPLEQYFYNLKNHLENITPLYKDPCQVMLLCRKKCNVMIKYIHTLFISLPNGAFQWPITSSIMLTYITATCQTIHLYNNWDITFLTVRCSQADRREIPHSIRRQFYFVFICAFLRLVGTFLYMLAAFKFPVSSWHHIFLWFSHYKTPILLKTWNLRLIYRKINL